MLHNLNLQVTKVRSCGQFDPREWQCCPLTVEVDTFVKCNFHNVQKKMCPNLVIPFFFSASSVTSHYLKTFKIVVSEWQVSPYLHHFVTIYFPLLCRAPW